MNILDKVVNAVAPVHGMKRIAARKTLEFMNSGYSDSGASHTKRSLKGFTATSRSPQEDIDANLTTLIKRSRSLYMGSPIATSIIKTTRTNVVGSGLRLKARIDYEFLGISEEESEKIEAQLEREFSLWAESKECDALNINNFYEMQSLFLMGQLLNGDGFCLRKYKDPTYSMPYGLRLQLVESDRICTPNSIGLQSQGTIYPIYSKNPDNDNDIWNGVEIDKEGAAVAYWIANQYPYQQISIDFKPLDWNRVPIVGDKTGLRNVLHSFDAERPEQRRGVPMLAPVIESLKQITRYTDAELTAAVISGMFSVFIKLESPSTEVNIGEATPDFEEPIQHGENDYQLGNGTINMLSPNESIQIADPKRPNTGFDRFVSALAKQIGSAVEVPQQLLLKEFNASYSASRAALLEAWKMFKMRRESLVRNFCQPVYEMFVTEAVARGRIKAKGFFDDPVVRKAWCGADWNGAAAGMIDPTKEVAAAKERVAEGFSTREEETMGLTGGDFKKNAKQLARENKLIKEAKDALLTMAQLTGMMGANQPPKYLQKGGENDDEKTDTNSNSDKQSSKK